MALSRRVVRKTSEHLVETKVSKSVVVLKALDFSCDIMKFPSFEER
jgi:hypothetical protein